jgi:phosphoribosyl-ATP pyrophosphohydrolase/phosphoribosyl-AMP cyclohydrolase
LNNMIKKVNFNEQGLIPTVIQDDLSEQVLMVAWSNEESLRLTIETGQVHFWSRSRQALWRKGATSGNLMLVESIHIDCDKDTLLIRVKPTGPVCHTGEVTCFFRTLDEL